MSGVSPVRTTGRQRVLNYEARGKIHAQLYICLVNLKGKRPKLIFSPEMYRGYDGVNFGEFPAKKIDFWRINTKITFKISKKDI